MPGGRSVDVREAAKQLGVRRAGARIDGEEKSAALAAGGRPAERA